jgi:hypothetical protein
MPPPGGHAGGMKGTDASPPIRELASVNGLFRGLMWIVAIVLVGVIAVHLVPTASTVHHSVRVLR